MKILVKGLIVIVLAGFIVSVIVSASILLAWSKFKPVKSDCIIVLGCKVNGSVPSPFLISRVREGVKLYKEGYGKYIIMSGGRGPGEDISEAEAMKKYALSLGVNSSSILLENKSVSTMTNLINSKKIMDEKHLYSAVIVSNKYHLERVSLMARKAHITPCSFSGVFNSNYKFKEFIGFVREIPAICKFYVFDNR